jgi:uncharacterized lipoprotein YajG
MRAFITIVTALAAAAVIAGCDTPAPSTPGATAPAATSPGAAPASAAPTITLPDRSVRPFPSPTIEIPPPID